MKKKTIFLLIAISVGLIGYGFWSQRGTRTLVLSKTGTYEADLRIANVIDRTSKEQEIKQWRLDIPNEYIQWKQGRNGIPNKDINRPKFGNPQEIRLSAIVNHEAMTLTVNPSASKQQIYPDSIFFTVRNKPADKNVRAAEHCLTLDQWHALHGRTSLAPFCKDHMALCSVFMNVEGWNVDIWVDRDLYESPEPYCKMVKAFLDKNTVQRDSISFKR